MEEYISEAEALSDIYDDSNVYSIHGRDNTYTRIERREYCNAKSNAFRATDEGKFVLVKKAERNRDVVPTLYLVDRDITKRFWWSPSSFHAMIFEKKSAAEIQAKKYRYGNVKVKQITKDMCHRDWFEEDYE